MDHTKAPAGATSPGRRLIAFFDGAFCAYERMVAWRYLRSRRREAFISVIAGFSFLGIMLGVATLIIVMAVMNGFRGELIDRILGVNGHMMVQPIDQPLNDYPELVVKFAAIPGVISAIPSINGQALVSGYKDAGTGAVVRGIRADDLSLLGGVSDNIQSGDLIGFAAVSAIFEIGMSEYDSSIIYMPLSEAQLYFNVEGLVQSIELFVDNPDEVDMIRPLVEAAAGRQIYITDWRQQNRTFFSALEVERNVMFMILTLIVLVAALNIVSGLIMLVKDKGHDIAILRTMGATSGAILRIFFMTGAAIGVAGTFAGVFLGVLVCWNIESIRQFFSWLSGATLFDPELYFLSQLPADMNLGETLSIVVMAIGLSFLATLIPAWRASRLDPVDALRYE